MGFFRLLWQRASDVQSLSSVFGKPIEWSFMFRVHVLLVAVVIATMISHVNGFFVQAGVYIQKLPAGIVAEKKGAVMTVTGLKQPFTFRDGDFTLVVDTTTSTVATVANGVTVSARELVITTPDNTQHFLWGDTSDTRYTSDDVVAWWHAHESSVVVWVTLALFALMLASKLIESLGLVALWSLLVYVVHRVLKLSAPSLRDLFALNMVALVGPLFLWTVLSIGGFGGATLIETIAFVVYSSVALQVAKGRGAEVEKK